MEFDTCRIAESLEHFVTLAKALIQIGAADTTDAEANKIFKKLVKKGLG